MTSRTMLAMQVTGKAQLGCVEVPVPTPAAGQALVRMDRASVCGSDLHIVDYGWLVSEYPLPPGYPGHEGLGTVVDPNGVALPDGTPLKTGDRVLLTPQIYGSFCFAEYQALSPAFMTPLPGETKRPDEHLLMAQQLGTVIFAAKRLPNLLGRTCVVMGQGSAGLFWNFVLKRLGAERVIAVEPIPHRLWLGERFGSDEQVGATFGTATTAVMDLTGGQGGDVVIEAVGTPETLSHAIELVRPEGQVVWFGVPQSAEPVPFNFDLFFRKRVSTYSPLGAQDEPGLASFRQALRLINGGEIDMAPIVSHSFHITRIADAFEAARRREDGAVKVAITF